ncbi:MAG: nucleotide disphospho-sugar-binding domain-containing protein [Pseudomonadota bacterium]
MTEKLVARVALVWELGGELGHVVAQHAVAAALSARGHRPMLVLRDVSRIHQVDPDNRFTAIQAPCWAQTPKSAPPAINFVDALSQFGFSDASGLESICRAWRYTFDTIAADCLVFNHAPTARLAAQGLSLPSISVESSFSTVPALTPVPVYAYWDKKKNQDQLQRQEYSCTTTINKVLRKFDAPEISGIKDLYAGCGKFVSSFPALDVYGPRSDVNYVGTLTDDSIGQQPKWPLAEGPKIFAYLKINYPYLDFILTVLGRLKASVIAYIPRLGIGQLKKYQTGGLSFSTKPLALSAVASEADFAISHAGAGTLNTFAIGGTPQFLLPIQIEQLMNAHRAADAGIAAFYSPPDPPQVLQDKFKQFFSNETLPKTARQWADTNRPRPLSERMNLICEAVEDALI